MSGAAGALTRIGIGLSSATMAYDCQNAGLKGDQETVDSNGMRGTRSRIVSRVRRGVTRVAGPLGFVPNGAEIVDLLAWGMGSVTSGTYTLLDTLTTRVVTIDKVAGVFTYAGCAVDNFTLRATKGQAVHLDLNVVGKTSTSASFPSISYNDATSPWSFLDCAITIGGTTVFPEDFTIRVDNRIDKDRFYNSATLVSAIAHDRIVTFATELSYGDNAAIYGTGLLTNGISGLAVVCTITNGLQVLTLTMNNVVFPADEPAVSGKREVMLPIAGQAYMAADGSSRELSVVQTTS